MVTVDSKQLFIGLNATERKIAYLSGGGLAISQEWTEFMKERNRDLEVQQSFSNIKPLSEAYASREGLIFCRPTGVRIHG